MKLGRPTKLAPEVQEKILTALRAGNWRGVACTWAGIAQRTFREWMAHGKAHPESAHGAFRRQVLEAEKSAEMRMVALVMKAAVGDARHAEWWLERKANPRWGRRDKLEHAGAGGGPLEVVVRVLAAEGEDAEVPA